MANKNGAVTLSEDKLLAAAIRIAATCHEEQQDKNGVPYALHPLRMLQKAILRGESRRVQIVAVLHDVLEDCPEWSVERLTSEGFPPVILEALDHVTKREEESGEQGYPLFVERICQAKGEAGRIARRVKILDLEDNMDVLRYTTWTDKVARRIKRYFDAHQKVTAVIAERDGV